MKKRRYLLPLAVGVLTVAVTGGVIFAQTSRSQESLNSQIGTSPEGLSRQISSFDQGESGRIDLSHGDFPNQSIVSRVADILDIKEEVLQGAFDQALWDKQNDSLAYRLEHLIENEKLTKAEAAEILDWFRDRPPVAAKLQRVLLRGEDAVEYRLNHMVERGVISQQEADDVLTWYEGMPQALKDLLAQRMHRSPDSQARDKVRPSQRFQGRDMNRAAFEGQRLDREGQRFDREGQRPDREGFASRDFRRPGVRPDLRSTMPEVVMEDAPGLDQAGLP